MEAIPPGEAVMPATILQSEPPPHTAPGHEECAYYVDGENIPLECPHGYKSIGAFYSEDYVRELKDMITHLEEQL